MTNTFSAEEAAALRVRRPGVLVSPPKPAQPAASPPAAPAAAPSPAADPAPADTGTADATAADTIPADTATADPAPAGDDTPAPDADDAAAPKAPKGSASARIQELIEERNALRAYGKHLESRIAEGVVKAPAQPAAPPAPPAAAAKEAPPKLEDFGFDATKHAQALEAWTAKQIEAGVEAGVQKRFAERDAQSTRQQFEARCDTFAATVTDWNDVISNPALPAMQKEAAAYIVKSETGPAVVYHLGKNPDLAVRISRMSPDAQLAAIGRIEAQISAKTPASSPQKAPAAPRAATRAPAPPTPTPSGSSPGTDPNSPSASMTEFVNAHRAKFRRPARR